MIHISGAPPNRLAGGPPPPPYYDNYSGPANPACFLTLDAVNDWGGQSFTTTQKYNLAIVELWIKKGPGANVGDVDVELYAVEGNGHPTGSLLNSGVIPNADISEDYAWVSCNLNNWKLTYHLLSAATKYCVVVHGLGFTVVHLLKWACGGDGSDYPNGDQEWSTDGGVIWSTDNARDQLFRCYPPPFFDNYSGSMLEGGQQMINSAVFWAGQSFTAMKSYTLERIDTYFHKDVGMEVGDIVTELYHVDGEGKPTGGALTAGTIHNEDVPEGTGEFLRCGVSPYDISVDTKYANVIRGPSLGPSNVIRVRWDYYLSQSDFEGGEMMVSGNAGATWVIYDTKDFLFRCYGSV